MTVASFGIVAGVLAFWLLLVWRVRVEKGWVGITPARRILLHLARATAAIAAALTPAIQAMTVAIRRFADAWEHARGDA